MSRWCWWCQQVVAVGSPMLPGAQKQKFKGKVGWIFSAVKKVVRVVWNVFAFLIFTLNFIISSSSSIVAVQQSDVTGS